MVGQGEAGYLSGKRQILDESTAEYWTGQEDVIQ
jgi:hypothetical protein